MKLIVGLGNPGKEFLNTRHNVGFMCVDYYNSLNKLDYKSKFNGLYAKTKINSEDIILLKPQSFMNLSGIVVRKYVDFFKINIEDILVIYDDLDFQVGKFKIKPSGSSAGHNGIKDIINKLGTDQIKRVRIGISKESNNLINYVLGNFNKKDKEKLNKVIEEVSNIINEFSELSFENLMNKYN